MICHFLCEYFARASDDFNTNLHAAFFYDGNEIYHKINAGSNFITFIGNKVYYYLYFYYYLYSGGGREDNLKFIINYDSIYCSMSLTH